MPTETPFYTKPDPAAAYLAAVQEFIGCDPTGIWDQNSHARVYQFIPKLLNTQIPAVDWGKSTSQTADLVAGLFDSIESRADVDLVKNLLVLLGLPPTGAEFEAWVGALTEDQRASLQTISDTVKARIIKAESTTAGADTPQDEIPLDNGDDDVVPVTPDPQPEPPVAPPPAVVKEEWSTGAKVALGLGIAAAVGLIGYAIYRASASKKDAGPMEGLGCGCGE